MLQLKDLILINH